MPEFASPASPDNPEEGVSLETLESDDSNITLEDNRPYSPVESSDTLVRSIPSPTPPPKSGRFKRLRRHFNIYSLLFILVLLLAGIITAVAYFKNQKSPAGSQFTAQSLSQNALEKVASSDATVGSPNQVLNVQSSAVFGGKVLVRKDLEIAGNLQIGGTVGLTTLAVAGTSQFGQVQVNKGLSVAGDTGLQGGLTVAKSLQVSGSGSFSGPLSAPQITTGSLQLNGDLILSHHIKTTGAAPGRSPGTALGSGGTTTIAGNDASGTVTVNTGGSPAAGCFVTVNFTSRYSNTPHILITPVGAASGGLDYYVNRTAAGFSICDASPPPGGSALGFDYIVVE